MAFSEIPFALTLLLITSIFFNPTTASPPLESQQLEPRGGGWTDAYWASQQGLTAATQAQCPAWAPINCNAIQEPDYCCTPSTYCARASDNSIGCCPWGQTCTPNIAGAAGGSYQQTSWVQPTTTWQPQPQPSTVYVTEGHATTTVVYAAGQGQDTQYTTTQQQPQSTVFAGQEGQYCSTLYAHGGNLPTTEAGTCGTILIANEAGRGRGVEQGVAVMGVLVAVGWLVLGARVWVW